MQATKSGVLELVMLETRLLNERRFRDWLALYSDHSYYWIPGQKDQDSPESNLSLLIEDRQVMEARVLRLESTYAWSNQPTVRAVRLLSDLRITDESASAWGTSAYLLMVQTRVFATRAPTQHLFAGTVRHRIEQLGDSLKIAWKRVDLIDADAASVQAPEPI